MRFLYKAKNNKGEIVTGTVKANNAYDAEKVLIEHQLVALEIISERKQKISFNFGKRITVKDRAIFARQLATMISAGLPLTKAVVVVTSQARNERIKNIYHAVFKDLEEGSSFSQALSKHPEMFDRVFVSVINSGETTGKLDVVLNQLATQLEKDNNFVSKVKSIMYYPAFITLALVGVSIYMITVIIPQLKLIFDQSGSNLPMATKLLLGISDFMLKFWWLMIVILVLLISVFRIWIISESGSRTISRLQILIPGINKLVEGIYMSRFARVMEMLVASGVPLLDALRTGASIMKNELYEEGVNGIILRVEKGVPLSAELLKNPIFPPIIGQMVAVGEETGKLDKVLGKVADYFEEDTDTRIKSLSTLIEPVVLVIIGMAVAFLVFAVLLPIFNLAKLQ
ncbi:MAG: type II secretion system F family protein [Patescibacteria group bacterium]